MTEYEENETSATVKGCNWQKHIFRNNNIDEMFLYGGASCSLAVYKSWRDQTCVGFPKLQQYNFVNFLSE